MAAPLWQLAGDPQDSANRQRFRSPTILRFASDSFMPEFLDLLNTEPQRLNQFVAAPETWSSPASEPAAPTPASGLALTLVRARNAAIRKLQARGTRVIGQLPGPAGKVMKLYQPSHGRFYLVTACLVCRTLGLPDRRIDAGAQERVTFVIRLLQPRVPPTSQAPNPDPDQCIEFALVNGAWQALTDPATLATGEEQKPLAPASYTADDQRTRRLLVGLVPVGDRERLLQAAQPNPGEVPPLPSSLSSLEQGPPATSADGTLQMLLKTQVIGPMSTLEQVAKDAVNAASGLNAPTSPPPNPIIPTSADADKIRTAANARIQTASYYILLDLINFFGANIPTLQKVILGEVPASSLTSAAEITLWNTLNSATYSDSSSTTTLARALKLANDQSTVLENVTSTYHAGAADWPIFTFQFYAATSAGLRGLSPALARPDFENQIVQALPVSNPNTPLPIRSTAQAYSNPHTPVWFAIRCVLERPNCGALTPPLVSDPTVAFQMAAYFDADAPARPVRIGLPVDTTPAGLRKFDKNTAFVMSDTLCGQVSKMSSLSFADLIMSVLPFPLHKDLDTSGMGPCSGGGMVCSFSIPIITIVALILLIIFVKLLDIVFFWMPFFQICLPLPDFSAKES